MLLPLDAIFLLLPLNAIANANPMETPNISATMRLSLNIGMAMAMPMEMPATHAQVGMFHFMRPISTRCPGTHAYLLVLRRAGRRSGNDR
ncbi:hypothetical protein [Paractinoplanes lichenicola]|uniref:Secreted protein n=1 Tax=Paractinoplanes lichenicola TaxID=2802976 RepID=A0ABS1W658_9ACTN|nr:hypothetical protein [Actinoplanes lichenicola]MBL7262215.1 hypothetical protein [Actinoplanes lichenicola]